MNNHSLHVSSEQAALAIELQDKLTGALIGLARAMENNEHLITDSTNLVMLEALCQTASKINFDIDCLNTILKKLDDEKRKMVPNCYTCASPCGRTSNYDMNKLWSMDANIRSLKTLILLGLQGLASYAYPAACLGYSDPGINFFFYRALYSIGMDSWGEEDLLPVMEEIGAMDLKCKVLLEQALNY